MSIRVYDISEINSITRPKKKAVALKASHYTPSMPPGVELERWVKLLHSFPPWKPTGDNAPGREVGEPFELETLEDLTGVMVNIVRKAALIALQSGQCCLAADLCKAVVIRILKDKYIRGKIKDLKSIKVSQLVGSLVQQCRKELVLKADSVLCYKVKGRWIIKRKV